MVVVLGGGVSADRGGVSHRDGVIVIGWCVPGTLQHRWVAGEEPRPPE